MFALALALLAAASHAAAWWQVLALGVSFSYALLTNYALLHEATHDNLHPDPRVNHALGVLTGLLFPIPFSLIHTTHHNHHRRNRTDSEMFDLYYPGDNKLRKWVQWYGILLGFFWPLAPLGAVLFAFGPRRARELTIRGAAATGGYLMAEVRGPVVRSIRGEMLLIVAFFAAAFWLLGLRWRPVLACYALFSLNWSTRQYIGHAYSRRHVIEGAWNLRHFSWMSWLLLHGEYDLNHHRRPDVPWRHLPRLSAADEPRRSYLRQYWRQWRGPRPNAGPAPTALEEADGEAPARMGRSPVSSDGESFFAWPGWAHLRLGLGVMAVTGLWFALIYGGCDWITAHRSLRVPLHFAWELSIPFVPAATLAYMSIYLPMWLTPLVLRRRAELLAAGAASLAVTAAAGACFLLLPAEPAYPPPPPGAGGVWAPLFAAADALNLDYNLFPSLHVALSAVLLLAWTEKARAPGRAALTTWALAIGASTLLTHQHHLLDALGGYALAGVGYAGVYRPLAHRLHGTPAIC